MTKLAIFDCDGTLVDGQANHCVAMHAAFASAGFTPPPASITRRVIGLSLLESMRKLIPDASESIHGHMVESYKSAYLAMRDKGQIEEPLYDGIGELLSRLVQDGWLLGVATGKSNRGLNRCLDHHGIKGLFVTLQTADGHPSKPHPSMVYQALADAGVEAKDAIMIGDTVFDIHMGKAAGTGTIGVSWGYHPVDELRSAGADAVAESMDELYVLMGEFT